jgi:transcriptional regulator with XRE-family HTH domain
MSEGLPTLGNILRALRTRNGWTRKEMSGRTGIPLSTLAKVEKDKLTLGYDKLLQISQRLKMRISELLAHGDVPASRVMTRRSIGTLETAVRVNSANYDYYFFCPDLRKKRMIPIFGRPHARTLEEFGEMVRHAGEEFIFVLTGRIEVHTEFYAPAILEPGQCMYIDSGMGHAYLLAPGCDEASALSGCTSEDGDLLDSLTNSERHATAESQGSLAGAIAPRPRKAPRAKLSRGRRHDR